VSQDVVKEFRSERIVACLRFSDAYVAREAAFAALRGGVRVLEVTLTTPGALQLIEELAKDEAAIPGAGTVLEVDDVWRVAQAGARFVMSPVTDEEVVAAARKRGLLAAPGAATPNEVQRAVKAGASVVKLFPIGQLGGPDFVRALRGPFPNVPFMPTNGVTLELIPEYLSAGVLALGFGSEIFPKGAVSRRDFAAVESAARRLVAAVADAERSRG
jgi:2-dehydro-3-deoxyphosphogluconate aldolase/(4S)-4-hydroxy-2-oxoglutarate aldolase